MRLLRLKCRRMVLFSTFSESGPEKLFYVASSVHRSGHGLGHRPVWSATWGGWRTLDVDGWRIDRMTVGTVLGAASLAVEAVKKASEFLSCKIESLP